MITNPIPYYASKYEYKAGRRTAIYYVWHSTSLEYRVWFWMALGGNGTADSKAKAQEAARDYIKNGKQ